jgi:AAA domain
MINFPLFNRLDVAEYGLFPGTNNNPGLHIDFRPGLTLILGANGLGKTTLITMLFRLVAGPFDIPGLSGADELGNIKLEPKRIPVSARRSFAQRVSDNASTATACLNFKLADHTIAVERRLNDLTLKKFQVDGSDRELDEISYQKDISTFIGGLSFGDWILLLRYMVFYFEDRRSLVWDATAQRQVLRLLFLPPNTANEWIRSERAILELDSSVRNLQFALTREEGTVSETESQIKEGGDVRQELKALQELQKVDVKRRDELNDEILDVEALREQTRLRFIKSEQEREARYREFERAKLLAIEARFPKHSDTARYILAQILSEKDCLVCGSHVPAVAKELESRIHSERCVICGSDISSSAAHVSTANISDKRVAKSAAALHSIEPILSEARSELETAENEYSSLVTEATELSASTSTRSARIDSLVRRLPPEEADLHRQREELAGVRTRLATMRAKLTKLRKAFSKFVEQESRAIVAGRTLGFAQHSPL